MWGWPKAAVEITIVIAILISALIKLWHRAP